MNIVAIGGGSVGEGQTRALDLELIRLTGKLNPKALFIPTATEDEEGYVETFSRAYSDLGCTIDILRLLSGDDPSKISDADLVYVGGGNTKFLVEVWREHGVDKLLRTHLDAGKPVGGVSAGALCWFRVGNSDWPRYEGVPNVNTARLDCLGFVDLVLCPHTLREEFRLDEFREMMKGETGTGVGVDDCCALQIKGDTYRVIASLEGSVAHRIKWVNGVLEESILAPHEDFRPLADL